MAYADPLIFAAAVAMKTQRVRIGFAVVELALHHPVRLAVEKALDQTWAQRGLYVSESDKEAIETATLALKRYRDHLLEARKKYNPGGVPPRQPGQAPPPGEVVEHAFLAGSPQRVAAQIAALRDAGVRNLLLNVNVGQISHEKVERSMRLFGAKVLPVVPP